MNPCGIEFKEACEGLENLFHVWKIMSHGRTIWLWRPNIRGRAWACCGRTTCGTQRGTIGFESKMGEGTEFKNTLPKEKNTCIIRSNKDIEKLLLNFHFWGLIICYRLHTFFPQCFGKPSGDLTNSSRSRGCVFRWLENVRTPRREKLGWHWYRQSI